MEAELSLTMFDFVKDFLQFKKLSLNTNRGFEISWAERRVILSEKTKTTSFDRHYIYHPAWAARILAKTKPKFHVDISSSLSFASIVSAFIPVRFYDYRPANLKLSNLTTGSADLTRLHFKSNSISSLSCMHTVEHIGLGRYGDVLDPDGDLKAIAELKRVLAGGGSLLFVVPIGQPKIIFNAHRIYSYKQLLSHFQDLTLKEFALLPDPKKGDELVYNPTNTFCDQQKYACGCFHFKKL